MTSDMVKTYTERYKGFQIRDVIYLGERPKDIIQFDIIKWYTDAYDNEEHSWSVGRLIYDPKEPCFDFKSIGLRWLEEHPDEDVENWIIAWCEYKVRELYSDC